MLATYKAITLDGKEHSDLDQFTLKQWYFARRLRDDSFICSSETGEWKLLKNLFDPVRWAAEERQVRGLAPTESLYQTPTSPEELHREPEATSQTPYIYHRVNEKGLRAAGILLLVNAACTVVSMYIVSAQTGGSSSGAWYFSLLLDILVGAKLLRSDNAGRWQKVALVRAGLGALFLGGGLIILAPNETIRLLGLLELVFASSFFILLVGEASGARVKIGVATFIISVGTLFTVLALNPQGRAALAKGQIVKYAKPDRSFVDSPSGGRIDLPDGWLMLTADNPYVVDPHTNMIAVHPDTESYATVAIVKNKSGPNLDVILSGLVAEQQKRVQDLVEVERVNALFGRLDGRKALLTWKVKGIALKGELTVARNGSYYIFVQKWCAAESYSNSQPQFAALDSAASAGEPQPDTFSAISVTPK
jgi:hypothetical protein